MTIDAQKPSLDTVLDVTEEQIARVYAQAFMDLVSKSADPTALIEEFESFVSDVVQKLPQLKAVLFSQLVAAESKEQLLDRMIKDRAAAPVLNFLKVLARHERLPVITTVAKQLKKLDAERRGITDVEVRLATETDDALLTDIESRLRKALGREPALHVVVDPELVAGFVVRVGDRVFDGSIRTQLEHVRRAMIERATHGIESSPQRFAK